MNLPKYALQIVRIPTAYLLASAIILIGVIPAIWEYMHCQSGSRFDAIYIALVLYTIFIAIALLGKIIQYGIVDSKIEVDIIFRHRRRIIKQLTNPEKTLLKLFMDKKTRSLSLDISHPVVAKLLVDGVINRDSEIPHSCCDYPAKSDDKDSACAVSSAYAVSIGRLSEKLLKKEPKLLEIKSE